MAFPLYYLFTSKLFFICFFEFFFVKHSNDFFSVAIANSIFPRHSIFNFFNHKTLFRSIWSVTFCKNISTFLYSNNIRNFKFRVFIIEFPLLKSTYVLEFTSTGFILIVLCMCCCNFIFQGSNESFSNNWVSFILHRMHLYIIILNK